MRSKNCIFFSLILFTMLGLFSTSLIAQNNIITNGEFGSSDGWTVLDLGDNGLDVDFNYTADGPTGGSGAGLRLSSDSADVHTAVYQPLLVTVGAKYELSMLLKNLAGAADKQWMEILLTPIMPDSSGFDGEAYRITKIDGWSTDCLPVAATFDGDLAVDFCDFGYPNNVDNGILTIAAADGETAGDVVTRYIVIKSGVCCDGVAPDWVFDNISLTKKSDPVTRTSIENGEFGSSDGWTVLDLGDNGLDVDFNYTADGPTGGSGAGLRLSSDSADVHTAVYQPLLVTVGAKYELSMLLKNLAGAADKQWMEILLTPVEPDGSGFDGEAYRITKIDGWSTDCLPVAATFDGDLAVDFCDFGYPNNVDNGILTIAAASGETVGDVVMRYFVIKSGVCCDGVAPDWVFDNISLTKKSDPVTRTSIENGEFGSSDGWTVLDLGDNGLDVDFNYTADGPTGGSGAGLRLSSDSADVHTAVYQPLLVEVGAKYDLSMLLKNLAGAADKQWMEILLTPIEPDGSGFDSEVHRIAKIDGWSTDCLPIAATFDGDLAIDYCEFGYPNNVDNGVLTIAAADGETAGDMAMRYFVIKTGVCCDGVAPDWVFDNISLEWKSGPVIEPPDTTNNLFLNGDFSAGASNWAPQKIGATVTFSFDNEEFFADIQTITDQAWHIALWQKPIILEVGKTYTMSFDARATAERVVSAKAQMNGDPWEGSLEEPIMINTEMKNYSVTWTQEFETRDYKVGLFLGADTANVWIDNMMLYEGERIGVTALTDWVPGLTNNAVPGDKRLMTVFIMAEHNGSDFFATDVTYGGQAMTLQIDTSYGDGYRTYTGIFTLDEAGVAAASSGSIEVTWDVEPSGGSDVVSVLLGNVNQDMPVSMKARSATNDSTASSAPLYANQGDMVTFCGATSGQNTTSANNDFIQTYQGESGWGDAIVAYKMGSDADETPSFNQEGSGRMPISAIVILRDGNSLLATYDIAATAENGSVQLSPEGPYKKDQIVTATAVADSGYQFFWWSGDINGNDNPIEISVTGDMNINAAFVDENTGIVPWLEEFSLANGDTSNILPTFWTATRTEGFFEVKDNTFMVNGDGSEGVLTTGIINIPPGGAVDVSLDVVSDGGLEDDQDYVQLYKIVDGGDTLLVDEVWGGTDSTTLSQQFIIGSTIQLMIKSYVSFESEFYYIDNLSVQASVGEIPTYGIVSFAQNGSFTYDPAGPYDPHTLVTVTAVPDTGYVFSEWLGDLTGSENPIILMMDKNKSISAIFSSITGVEDEKLIPKYTDIKQNYPNPFNPTTTIKFQLKDNEHVNLTIYNTLGQEVANLLNKDMDAGYHLINFNASDLSSGMYFYRLEAGSYTNVRKMMLLK